MVMQSENTSIPGAAFNSFHTQLNGIVAQSPIPMVMLKGREGICEVFNPPFAKIWNYRNVQNKPITEAWPEIAAQWQDIIESIFEKGETVYHYTYAAEADWQDNGNRTLAWFDFAFSPHRDAGGIIDGVIITGFDVTARVEAFNKLAEQELLLKNVTEAAATALWVIDVKGDITYVSQAWLNWTGRPVEAHLGRGWLECVVEEDREIVFHRFAKGFAAKTLYDIDFRIIRADGELQWIAATGKPRYLADGAFAGYVGSCMDITERKEAGRLLHESQERFRRIADSAPVFIWMTDTEKRITFLNKSWLEFTGNDFNHSVGEIEPDEVHPDEKKKVLEMYTEAFDNRDEFYMEFRLKRHDDTYRWIGMKCIPLYQPNGDFEGYIGSGMDINENKEHEQIKNEFIGMASHELKTPITSMKAYVQLLLNIYKNEDDDEFLKKSLSTINKQINKLTRLITDLLDVSKIESGRLSLNSETFILNDLLKECIDEVQHASPKHDIVFTADTDFAVYADRDRIAQVITNLLTNAVKYSPETDRIDVSVTNTEGQIVVCVQDYGIGISTTEQQKVFNRFYRVEGRNEQTFSGFGIGLYVAAEIIRRHNGLIWVASEKGKGSAFCFALPEVGNSDSAG